MKEVQEAMQKANIVIDQDELEQIFSNVSPELENGEKKISYSNFIQATLDLRTLLTKEKLWSLFKFINSSKTNTINCVDLQEIMKRHGREVS